MRSDDGSVDVGNSVFKTSNDGAILLWETVAGGVRNIDYGSSCFDHLFDDFAEKIRFSSACIFGVKFYILDKSLRKFDCCHPSFYDVFWGGTELELNMIGRNSNSRMNTSFFSVLKGCRCYFDIFFYGARKGTDDWVGYCFGNFYHGVKIPWTRDGKTSFNDIHSQRFQGLGHCDFLLGVELTSRHLLSISKGGIEYP